MTEIKLHSDHVLAYIFHMEDQAWKANSEPDKQYWADQCRGYRDWVRVLPKVVHITVGQYLKSTGVLPVDDDMDRVNCPKAGQIGHECCGWNAELDQPVFYGRTKHVR